MPATVEVRFKGTRKDYYLWLNDDDPLRLWESVIVPVERGLDFARVSATGDTALRKCAGCSGCAVGEVKPPDLEVVRRATAEDIRTANELRRSEEEARRAAIERVRARGLEMKVSDAEWQWDRRKLTVYFTAEQRVDFRELVRDLAQALHTRIELRQIGARDEAARLSGVGRCGREYCCSSWLTMLGPVSLTLAKDQRLSLNPAQISGGCGRLLCCLKYEHEFYVQARKQFPKEGRTVSTSRGPEKVVALDLFRERVFLRNEEQGPRVITLGELKAELEALGVSFPAEPSSTDRPTAQPPNRPDSEPPSAERRAPSTEPRRRKRRRRRRWGGPPRSGPNPQEPLPPPET
ncbi:MAG: PSP1 domain-containing protein [Gemmatimonadales bacterium]